jgi:hypothetical protein
MTTDVLRLQGDYLIQTKVNSDGDSAGGTITFDLGSESGNSTGTVYVNGNLIVRGVQTTLNSTDSAIKDTTITLNAGEPTALIPKVTKGTSGLKISRGLAGRNQDQFAAFFEYNDAANWHGTGVLSAVQGVWEFRTGKTGRPQYSAIKVNAIRIDERSACTIGGGAGQNTRLNIFGSDNPTSVLSVAGTNNYELRVTDDDDIPNKKYVDLRYINAQTTAQRLVVGNTYVTTTDVLHDTSVGSQIIAVLDGDPTERLNITTGTVVMRLTPTVSQFSKIQFVDTQIIPNSTNTNLTLSTYGTGQLIMDGPFLIQEGNIPTPSVGQLGLYTSDMAGGGTGVFFKKKDTLGNTTQDEFVSRKKAMIYSIIFG